MTPQARLKVLGILIQSLLASAFSFYVRRGRLTVISSLLVALKTKLMKCVFSEEFVHLYEGGPLATLACALIIGLSALVKAGNADIELSQPGPHNFMWVSQCTACGA